jgi:uncharacterized membrane protein
MQIVMYTVRQLALTLCAIFVVLSYAGTLAGALPHVIDPTEYFDFFGDRDSAGIRYWQTMLHIAPAMVALLVGALQFSLSIRKNLPKLHVVAGRTYLIAVLASGTGSLAIAPFALGGKFNAAGFALLAFAWIVTTLMAFWHVRNGRINLHRAFMIMSYALTLAGVTLRLQLGIFTGLMDMAFLRAYSIVAWSSWIPNLIVAVWWTRFRPLPLNKRRA